MRLRNLAVGLVSRAPARVQTKLLVAFLAMVALIILLGAVGLQVLSGMNARTEELAAAVMAHLEGKPLEEAYREQNIQLPPPGTPVTDPVDPSRLSAGMLGMFKDHFVVALSSVKALQDGEVVPLSSISSSPDFLAWLDPSATGGAVPTAAAPVPQVPASTPTPAPSPALPLSAPPVPTGIG